MGIILYFILFIFYIVYIVYILYCLYCLYLIFLYIFVFDQLEGDAGGIILYFSEEILHFWGDLRSFHFQVDRKLLSL